MATEQERHTSGPWFADLLNERREGGRFYVFITAKEQLVPICAVTSGVEGYGREEGRANARLIAAAPDLLKDGAFLADRLDELENDLLDDEVARQFHGHVAPALARFRAAIARATGEA